MADVGRAEDDLRQHPRQRARFDRDGATLAVDGRTRDPAAASGQIGDDVTGTGVGLDPRREQGLRRCRRKALEDRQVAAHVGA